MKKKGIALPETLKLIIGVVILVGLIYLGVKLYGLLNADSDLEQAKAHMDKISSIIGNLKEGDSVDYILLNPDRWALTVWPAKYARLEMTQSGGSEGADYTVYDIEGKPDKCIKENWNFCICLCKSESIKKDILSDCNNFGVCKEIKVQDVKINQDSNKNENEEIYINTLIKNKKTVGFSLNQNKLNVSAN